MTAFPDRLFTEKTLMLYFCKAIIKGYSDYIIYEMSARLQTDNMEPAAA